MYEDFCDEYYLNRKITSSRTIIHSDLNNFFASVEMLFHPSLKDVPMAVCGDKKERQGIVLAKNELAKKFGIKTGESVISAERKCAQLVTCPPRYSEYISYSKAVKEIYFRYTPYVESFGIDEAWLDVSSLSSRKSGPLFENAKSIAEEIMKTVFEEIGLKVSVGVSFNKVFSKLASDMKGRDTAVIISPDNYKKTVWSLPVGDLLYVGKNTEKLLKENRLFTLFDVACRKRSYMKKVFGKNGEKIWDFANGFDFSEVGESYEKKESDSVSKSRTLPYDITSVDDAEKILYCLCMDVTKRIKKKGVLCNTVKISLKSNDFSEISSQLKRKIPTDNIDDIFSDTLKLIRKQNNFVKPIRSVGISLEKLQSREYEQIGIFESGEKEVKKSLDGTVCTLKSKYGEEVLFSAQKLVKDFAVL